MAAPTITALETPSFPRHLVGTGLAMQIFNITTDGSPSDTTLTPNLLSEVKFVVGLNGYTITAPNVINITGAKLPTSNNFTFIAFGKGNV